MTAWSADGALVRRVGDAGLLIEFDAVIDPVVNARAVAVADALRRQHPPGVRDVVPTFRSVAVHFDPLTTDVSALEAAIRVAFAAGVDAAAGARHEIPVVYGGAEGPDLEPLATSLSLSPDVLVGLHAEPDYRVYMLGFLPGFAYLGVLNPRLDCPRHRQPRLRVPPGSVGLAGRQTGVYPQESPGGWQLVGRTATRMFDPDRPGATLVAAGDTVRFVRDHTPWPSPQPALGEAPPDQVPPDQRHVTILAPGLLTTVQDAGRWGSQDRGVPVAGAMDAWSRRVANAVVGNPASAAVLEATVTGPALRFEQDTVCAVTGADLEDRKSTRLNSSH